MMDTFPIQKDGFNFVNLERSVKLENQEHIFMRVHLKTEGMGFTESLC